MHHAYDLERVAAYLINQNIVGVHDRLTCTGYTPAPIHEGMIRQALRARLDVLLQTPRRRHVPFGYVGNNRL